MKKIFLSLISVFSLFSLNAQTQVAIGPQSASFTSWVRGYHFTAPVNFTICGIYVAPDMSTAAQNCAIVRFTAGAPPAFPGTTNSFVNLFQNQNYVPNSMLTCNVPVAAGDIIGVYGSRGSTCINSYDGANYATTIMGFPTTLQRSGMQQCLQAVGMANIWSEVANPCGRVFIYYNCCSVPSVSATATPTSVCSGMNVAILGGGASTYTWNPGNFAGNPFNVTPTVTTTYSVTGTSSTGCQGTATVNVTVNPNPTVTAVAAPVAICAGQSSNLTGGGATTYTWNPGNIVGAAISVTPAATTIYTVTGSSASGCTGSRTVQVTVNPLPVVNPGSNSPVCLGGNINLNVGAFNTYTWTGPNVFNSNTQNPVITNATAAMAGVYTVAVTNASGCVNSNTVNVVINALPVIVPANTGPYCVGQTISLSTPAAATYTWMGPNAFNSNAQNPTIPNAQLVNAGTYSVSATSAGGCIASGTTNVTVNAVPIPNASNNTPICAGNAINLTGGGGGTYSWSGPSFSSSLQNPTISNATAANSGTYTLTVTSAAGCTNTAMTTVTVNPMPVVVMNSNSPVCLNFPLNLSSTGGGTYSWSGPNAFSSALQNPTVPVATPVNAGLYTVTVTALGCTTIGTVNVVVTTPTTSAANTGPYCAGTTINLTAGAASSYTWSGPGGYSSNAANATQANSTPAMSGTYTVLVSIGTCTASATTNVVVNALPTPTATANSPVCVGQAINFTGSGGTTYTWTGPATFNSNSATPAIASATNANGGNYILTVTDANGCTNTANVNVVVNSLPVIAVANPTNCVNTTINLTSNGGVTYSWSGPGGYTSNVQNPNIANAQLTMSGTYVVTVTDANGCVNTANANVTVLPLPTPNITSNSPVCAGQTLNLFGTGAASYSWSGPGYTGPNQNPTINNVTASANGVYTLIGSSGTCTASTTFTVVINPVPVFNFSGSNVLCNGQSNGTSTVNVTVGTGPFNYNWSTIPAQTTQGASNLAAGTYSCTVTDANNCTSIASTQITQPTVFTVSINSATTSACSNSPINVNAVGAGGTGPYNYNWVSGPATSAYSVNEAVAGNYNYVVNATDAFNCPATANINLTFFPQPTVTATSATLCAGQTANLTASGANTYIWQPGNITGSTYPFSGNTSVNITVVGTANGCSNFANTNIIVNPNPSASINTSSNRGCAPSCVTFTASSTTSITSYGWLVNGVGISGSQNASYCFPESGTYTLGLAVFDNNGCTGVAPNVNIDVYPNPVADFNHAPIKPIVNQDQYVTFTDASYGDSIVSWNWYFMNTAQYTSIEQNPTFSYTEPGTYPVVLVVKSANGCSDTLIRPLVVGEDFGIYVPNTFTPNGDGVNDIFQPKGFGVTKYELNIFDRWGEKVFSTKDFEKGWDGTMQSAKDVKYGVLEEGTYSWLINATSVFGKSHELKGHVILMK